MESWAIVINPKLDNVAVAKKPIKAGTKVKNFDGSEIYISADIPSGHRFAIKAIKAGEWAIQYGQRFAVSLGVNIGDPVNLDTTKSPPPPIVRPDIQLKTTELSPWNGKIPNFRGFKRKTGLVGTRNWVLIVPTSMCSSHEAARIAMQAEMQGVYSREKYPNVDGVVAIPHSRGCGCPDLANGSILESNIIGSAEATLKILSRYIQHPNVGAVMVIELGCEKTNLAMFERYLGKSLSPGEFQSAGSAIRDFGERWGKPVVCFSVQGSGGTSGTVRRGMEIIPELLKAANLQSRVDVPISELGLGLKCGGSDAFSGLSANPALGYASDLLISAGGNSLITEIPEFLGAEHLFAERAVNREVVEKIVAAMERYQAYTQRAGINMAENPSPGNKAGGLINITIKSLGALAKSGTAPVQGVLDYGEFVWDQPKRGLYLLYSPGYDQESTPAEVASGCQVVCFTTGRGTGIGNAIAPVIKIASNTSLYEKMTGDIDINAGTVIDGVKTIEEVGKQIFDLVIEVASGKWVKAEENGHREFAIWSEQGISL